MVKVYLQAQSDKVLLTPLFHPRVVLNKATAALLLPLADQGQRHKGYSREFAAFVLKKAAGRHLPVEYNPLLCPLSYWFYSRCSKSGDNAREDRKHLTGMNRCHTRYLQTSSARFLPAS